MCTSRQDPRQRVTTSALSLVAFVCLAIAHRHPTTGADQFVFWAVLLLAVVNSALIGRTVLTSGNHAQ